MIGKAPGYYRVSEQRGRGAAARKKENQERRSS
jgi:hypothetical protein